MSRVYDKAQYDELVEIRQNPRFENWNTTSVEMVLYWAIIPCFNEWAYNTHAELIQSISIKLFKEFVDWYIETQNDEYKPHTGGENMYSKKWCKKTLILLTKRTRDLQGELVGIKGWAMEKRIRRYKTIREIKYTIKNLIDRLLSC